MEKTKTIEELNTELINNLQKQIDAVNDKVDIVAKLIETVYKLTINNGI